MARGSGQNFAVVVTLAVSFYTHTHPFNGPLSRTTRVSRYQKQETVSGSEIHWAICKSEPCSRQITTPAPHRSVFYRPDALSIATNSVKALKVWLLAFTTVCKLLYKTWLVFVLLGHITVHSMVCVMSVCLSVGYFLQCFGAVGWATEWWDAGVVICLKQGADLHIAQLIPLPLSLLLQ